MLHVQSKKASIIIEQHGYHAKATVKEYRKEYVRVAGSWHWLDYPYVEYLTSTGAVTLERLKFAQSPGRPFVIGEEIEVVRYDGTLYYRNNLLESYWWKYLPLLIKSICFLLALTAIVKYFLAV
ncbi:MAG: hypothetical protein H7Z21_19740 [Hymenobacter sp.]|nr:hypothetical protein [Hymenobacter sp.]